MKQTIRFFQGVVFVLALTSASAQAHQVWIEQDAKSAKLYFGEFNMNLREESPGLLDKFSQPTATHFSAKDERALKVEKTAHAFVVDGRAGSGESIIVQETGYPIFERKSGEHRGARAFWTPAARYVTSLAAQSPNLTLDIVPTGKAGEFQLSFKGQPLPKAKISITALSGWGKETRTDERGIVSFTTPWKGLYMVHASHTDATPGERNGEKYDVASYGTTLTFVQPSGLPAVPAPAPRTHDH